MNDALGVRWDDLPLLRDRAVSLLETGPARGPALAEEMFGMRYGPTRLAASLVREVLRSDPRFLSNRGRWRLTVGEKACRELPLREMEFVVVDVESTGGSPSKGDRLTEVAAVRMTGGEIVDCWESLVNPRRPIPPSVSRITQITDEMVAGAPTFAELADELRQAMEGAVFVAHNVSFDWRLLQAEFERCVGGRLGGEVLCTLRMARKLHPELRRRSLGALADYYSLGFEDWHRAGPDARATAMLLGKFLDRLEEHDVHDWGRLQLFLKGEWPPASKKEAKPKKKANGRKKNGRKRKSDKKSETKDELKNATTTKNGEGEQLAWEL
ncbi:MAG TPA: 3'-5' exonuclease [Gemmatimonadota bacterium]|nr:3'-5' exonuclease [Gemmatimonadota bacterium]